MLSRVIKGYSILLAPLENITAGSQSQDTVVWSEELLASFSSAQKALSSNKSIILPKPEGQLWTVSDGSVKMSGLGATLYVLRDKKLLQAGFFSVKTRKHQVTWLPCEVEALSVASAIKHFAPYIIQSKSQTCLLTDSKPCVQAFNKLCCGQFSSSPRVTTFLSTASRYQISLRHLAGSANMPSDFASRNAAVCDDPHCQICIFISKAEDSVVRPISIHDVLSGSVPLPFTSRSAWLQTQLECPDLRRVHSHLKQGTRPSKKLTNIRDVKRYLNGTTLSRDGLLVVRRDEPFAPSRECIIIPRQVTDGLLSALHIKLNHPSRHQLKQAVQRYFFALDLDKALDRCSHSCHLCASMKKIPSCLVEQSSTDSPDAVGISFAADVVKRYCQLILVLCETTTSFTSSCLIENEQRETLRAGLIRLSLEMHPIAGPCAVVRVDPAPGFTSLYNDEELRRLGIALEIGHVKNPNKNPVAEKCIAELGDELLRICPNGTSVTPLSLAIATANLNTRIRSTVLSSLEMWLQRDQFTNSQLPVSDFQLIRHQHAQRLRNHPASEKSKAAGSVLPVSPAMQVGDLVYITSDSSKTCARDRYLVVSVDGLWCNIRKFTGSQLRSTSYRVKLTECYRVPDQTASIPHLAHKCCSTDDSSSIDEELPPTTPSLSSQPQPPPPVPIELSEPRDQQNSPGSIEEHQPSGLDPPVFPVTPPLSLTDDQILPVDPPNEESLSVPAPRRSTRPRHLPAHLKDYVTYSG